jgi:hypothetical protein
MNPVPIACFVLMLALRVSTPAAAQQPAPRGTAGASDEALHPSTWASIREAYEDARHRAFEFEGGSRVRNFAQQYGAVLDGRGARFSADDGSWEFGLELTSLARLDELEFPFETKSVRRNGRVVEYVRESGITEWFSNHDRGVEHGFTIGQRPVGTGALVFRLAVRSPLRATAELDGRTVSFFDGEGNQVLRYANLTAVDADGRELPARQVVVPGGIELRVLDAGARYPITVDPLVQQAYLKASLPTPSSIFGYSVGVSGTTVVVGAPGESSSATGVNGDQSDAGATRSGAAYVFERIGGVWTQTAYLKASNTDALDGFGYAVAVNGDTIVIGAYLEDSAAFGVDGDQTSDATTNSGAAYVFRRIGSVWVQEAYLKGFWNNAGGDQFGNALDISGDTIVVGAPNNGSTSGIAYTFERSGAAWSTGVHFTGSNTEVGDYFGIDVAIDGDTIAVGAYGEDSASEGVGAQQGNDSASNAGAAYVLVRTGATWSQQEYLKAESVDSGDSFGLSVDCDGDYVIVGCWGDDGFTTPVENTLQNSGAAYAYERVGGVWSSIGYLKGVHSPDPGGGFISGAYLGNSVAVDESGIFVVGGFQTSPTIGSGNGRAYVYRRTAGSWTTQDLVTGTDPFDFLGISVAVDGDLVVVGAHGEDGSVPGVDGDESDNGVQFAGAAYVFGSGYWTALPGCSGNTGTLVAPTSAPRIGTTSIIEAIGGTTVNGVVATYYGATGVDGSGCGTPLQPGEELLLGLAPFPTLLGLAAMAGGSATQPLPIPFQPSIVGINLGLQSAFIDAVTFASEFSTGLAFAIQP